MTLAGSQAGTALAASAEETLRLWRSARRQARPDTFPGLLDGLVEPFVRAVGAAVGAGGSPEQTWGALAGVLRLPREGAGPEHEAEWTLAGEVAAAVADALRADPDVRRFAVAAARACWEGTRALSQVRGPSRGGVLPVWVLAGARR